MGQERNLHQRGLSLLSRHSDEDRRKRGRNRLTRRQSESHNAGRDAACVVGTNTSRRGTDRDDLEIRQHFRSDRPDRADRREPDAGLIRRQPRNTALLVRLPRSLPPDLRTTRGRLQLPVRSALLWAKAFPVLASLRIRPSVLSTPTARHFRSITTPRLPPARRWP